MVHQFSSHCILSYVPHLFAFYTAFLCCRLQKTVPFHSLPLPQSHAPGWRLHQLLHVGEILKRSASPAFNFQLSGPRDVLFFGAPLPRGLSVVQNKCEGYSVDHHTVWLPCQVLPKKCLYFCAEVIKKKIIPFLNGLKFNFLSISFSFGFADRPFLGVTHAKVTWGYFG